MDKNTDILNEIREISPLLASLQGIHVYTVPDGYFNHLAEDIRTAAVLHSIKQDITQKAQPQDVPPGYFENLSADIIGKVREAANMHEEADGLSFLPENLKQTPAYSVPDGYFEHLPSQIMEQVRPAAKVIPLYRRPLFKHAIAAAFAVILFVAVFFSVSDTSNGEDRFSAVSRSTVPDKSALKYNSEKAFQAGIASLSEDQIVSYLQNHGNILDNELLIQDADASGMPDPMEYLINDAALDEFLKEIQANGL